AAVQASPRPRHDGAGARRGGRRQPLSARSARGARRMEASGMDVVVVGSFNVDHVWRCEALPAPGATLAGEYASGPGGKGFNQAVAAARAGARTAFVCALGDD